MNDPLPADPEGVPEQPQTDNTNPRFSIRKIMVWTAIVGGGLVVIQPISDRLTPLPPLGEASNGLHWLTGLGTHLMLLGIYLIV